MSVFSPSPSYRVASRGELMGAAMDLPFSPLKNLGEQFRGGVLDSFGLGTVLKDFQIPRSTDTSNQPPVPAFNPIDLAYEGIHSLFGAKPGGKTLSQDDWKASPYYREELPWDAGMTEDRAAALALFYDQRVARQFFGQKDMVTTLLGGFAGGGVDPVNFIPVFGPVARAAATARAGFIIGHALIGASEAAINTAAFGYLTAPQRAALGDDVSLETSINNIVFSAGAGLLFGGVGGAFARRAARVSARAAAAEREIAEATQTIRNLRDTRDVLNDATVSLATRGEVDLQPKSGAILDRIATDVADRRDAARALEVETRGITGDKSGEVVISASGARVRVQPEVVELATLQKATGALQVRDRSRQASDAWIEETATRLDPALLMPAINADKGAPLVGPDNIIDSGNGRTSAIARAYAAYPDRAAAYRKAIEDAGYSTEGMTQPVLINRRLTELSPDARAQFNADSQDDTARMSATELASMDRAALDESALALLKEGPITSAANRGFVDRFLANLPASERGSLVDERGIGLNADGQRRIENALVAAAYGDVDAMVVRKFAEATDDNTRSIVGAMADVAGAWVRMRRAAKSGEISAELDQTPELTEALRRLSGWREQAAREGRKVGMVIKEGMGQLDVFTGEIPAPVKVFIRAFYNDADFTAAAGRDKIAGRLFDLVDTSLETGVPDLLGEARAATKMGVLKDAFLNDLEADLLEIDGMATRAGTLGEAGAGRMAGAGGQGDQGRIGQGGSGRPGAIRQLMSDRFAAGGRPRDEAEAAGAMVEAFYHGLAQRAGTAVDDLVARFGLPEVRTAEAMPEGALAQNFVPGRYGFNAVSPSVYPEAGAAVDGLVVRKSIPNRDSIAATFDDGDYTILKGVREIPFAAFRGVEPGVLPTVDARTRALADEIKTNGEINPLIVVLDKEGPYVLEGAHRFDALQLAGKESLPALVVVDHSEGSGIEILPDDAKVTFEAPDPRQMALFQSGQETINTPRFRAWFGDSKVVDENGEPLVVYHGSIEPGLKAFDMRKAVEVEGGIFFTDNRDVAAQYTYERAYGDIISDEPLGDVVEAYLAIKNPLIWQTKPGQKIVDAIEMGRAIEAAKAGGHDGVIVRNIDDSIGMTGDMGDVFIAFDPTQIKSTFNRGTFDPADPRILFQPAYHGTPHIFDKFDSSKIGTGEGAQAFGHGLYFAGRKEVAQYYRDALAGAQGIIIKRGGKEMRMDGEKAVARIEKKFGEELAGEFREYLRMVTTGEMTLDQLKMELLGRASRSEWEGAMYREVRDAVRLEKGGRLLTVDIPDDSELMTWDAPLSEQPEGVKAALNNVALQEPTNPTAQQTAALADIRAAISGGQPSDKLRTAADFYGALGYALGGEPAASAALREAGIPGHRFLDQQSRGGAPKPWTVRKQGDRWEAISGDGHRLKTFDSEAEAQAHAEAQTEKEAPTYNYVIYDDSRVNVTGFEQSTDHLDVPRKQLVERLKSEVERFADENGVDMAIQQVPDGALGDVELTDLFARETGKGAGTKVMQRFIELADEYGLNIYTHPAEPRNVDFYARFGFERERKPRYSGLQLVRYASIDPTELEQSARGSIQFGDTGSIITLLKNADASTALHESSHHFLMMFKSMAEQADAPLEIARDWSVVKDWWGANADRVAADSPADGVTGADVRAVLETGTTGDRIKDLAINVGLQEQWARGFERYAADGVAPTEGLRAVFAQFKDWLRRVYRALTDLRVDVSPEVKGVFDRLLGGGEEQAAFDLGQPAPRQPIDMTKPAPEPRPDGIEAAAARVSKPEEVKALAEQFGVKDDGTFAEEAEIEQMRATGRLTPEDEAALAFADQTAKDADAYAETLRAAAACVMG